MEGSCRMNELIYSTREAWVGTRRNAGAALAAAALVFAAMLLMGLLLMLRSGAEDIVRYMESQIGVKVYVEQGLDVQEVARILDDKDFVKSVEIEMREELLEGLSVFFQGREHLLASLKEGALPDAVKLELRDHKQIGDVVQELSSIQGIAKVIYPQQFAERAAYWSQQLYKYGVILLLFFLAAAFMIVFLSVNLALSRRTKEIRVKLLLGAKPLQVRGQFLYEGLFMGLGGGAAAAAALYLVSEYGLRELERHFPFVFHFSASLLYSAMGLIMLLGAALALLASFLSTRRMIKHV
ncbi:Cell division protein FtsX [compost metagenome]